MFGKKTDRHIETRLQSIKNAPPVNFAVQVKNQRAENRNPTFKFGIAITQSGEELNCIVRDLSPTGARLALESAWAMAGSIKLVIDGYGAPAPARVAWQNGYDIGVEFE